MVLINYVMMCFIFGTTFLAIKIGIDAGIPPFFSAGIRFFLAGLFLLLWMHFRGKTSFSLLFRKETLFTALGLTFGTFSTLYWAEQHVSSGIAAVLSATGPMMILLIQTIIWKQKNSRFAILGCMLGFIGVSILTLPSLKGQMEWVWLVGCLAIIIGEIGYAFGTVYSKNMMDRFQGVSPVALNGAQMTLGGLLLFLLSIFTEPLHIESFYSLEAAGSVLYLIIFGSMIGHSIYYYLVVKTGPIFPSTWLYISPFIALTLGIYWYQEPFTFELLIGGVLIIIGVLFINWDKLNFKWRKTADWKTNKLEKSHTSH
ncbi:DMT family transporter [Risungbinella massiliensis]|uniref:DMT family transporter n=1 Tax=Risungbinella massiliensis TaxID=1329796 RepID=UPI0005CC860C|nr:EamA family transporter [Risungbinella massiliensis]